MEGGIGVVGENGRIWRVIKGRMDGCD